MLRDITIGQYYPVKSAVHSLDARVKIAAVLVYIVTLFLVDSFIGYAAVAVVLGCAIAVSKVPLKFMLKGIKGILIILVFTAVINIFSTKGDTELFKIGIFTATLEGVLMALKMVIRPTKLPVSISILTSSRAFFSKAVPALYIYVKWLICIDIFPPPSRLPLKYRRKQLCPFS